MLKAVVLYRHVACRPSATPQIIVSSADLCVQFVAFSSKNTHPKSSKLRTFQHHGYVLKFLFE